MTGTTVNPAAPTASGPARVSEAEFAKMTPAQRLDYVRQFPQNLPSGVRSS
jgi:hypothetical protein